jgi:hypothetical protein
MGLRRRNEASEPQMKTVECYPRLGCRVTYLYDNGKGGINPVVQDRSPRQAGLAREDKPFPQAAVRKSPESAVAFMFSYTLQYIPLNLEERAAVQMQDVRERDAHGELRKIPDEKGKQHDNPNFRQGGLYFIDGDVRNSKQLKNDQRRAEQMDNPQEVNDIQLILDGIAKAKEEYPRTQHRDIRGVLSPRSHHYYLYLPDDTTIETPEPEAEPEPQHFNGLAGEPQ